jgi:hypothetical protein
MKINLGRKTFVASDETIIVTASLKFIRKVKCPLNNVINDRTASKHRCCHAQEIYL